MAIFIDARPRRVGEFVGHLRITACAQDGSFYRHAVQSIVVGQPVRFYIGRQKGEGELLEIRESKGVVLYRGRKCTINLDNIL